MKTFQFVALFGFLFFVTIFNTNTTTAQSRLLDIEGDSNNAHPMTRYKWLSFEPKTCAGSRNLMGFYYAKFSTLNSDGYWVSARFVAEKVIAVPDVYYLKHLATGKYLTVQGGPAKPGSYLALEPHQKAVKQRFRFTKTPEGYKIRSTTSAGVYVVELENACAAGQRTYGRMRAARHHNDDNQNFTIWRAN